MAHTNSTPNYNLPQFLGTDKPAWLTDVNNAMSDIDTAIAAAKTTADTADAAASALAVTVGNHTSQLSTLSGAVTSQGNTLNTVTSLIGNGVPTTTDQTIIGAINELHANQGDLADLVTTDKDSLVDAINEVAQGGGSPAASAVTYNNAGSGLTATNVQDAIDELAGGSVSVTADGVKTYATLLAELYALVDVTKINHRSALWVGDSAIENGNFHVITTKTSTGIAFASPSISGSNDASIVSEFKLASTSAYRVARTGSNSTTFNDSSSTVVTSGLKLAIFY